LSDEVVDGEVYLLAEELDGSVSLIEEIDGEVELVTEAEGEVHIFEELEEVTYG